MACLLLQTTDRQIGHEQQGQPPNLVRRQQDKQAQLSRFCNTRRTLSGWEGKGSTLRQLKKQRDSVERTEEQVQWCGPAAP